MINKKYNAIGRDATNNIFFVIPTFGDALLDGLYQRNNHAVPHDNQAVRYLSLSKR